MPVTSASSNKSTWILAGFLILILIIYILSLQLWKEKSEPKVVIEDTPEITIQEEAVNPVVTPEETIVKTESEEIVLEEKSTSSTTPKDSTEEFTGKYKLFQSFLTHNSWFKNMKRTSFTNTWGEENISVLGNTNVKVSYPKGSFKPSVSPRGGAGFIYDIGTAYKNLNLSYDIQLARNFDFVKGGKLPGLCGGTCPRGGGISEEGFSTNFIWKKEGNLAIAISGYEGSNTLGEGMAQLEKGKSYNLQLSLTLNDPGETNGVLQVFINDEEVYKKESLELRNKSDVYIDAFLFSTFFGGGEASWATPVDTSITFSNFQIYGEE